MFLKLGYMFLIAVIGAALDAEILMEMICYGVSSTIEWTWQATNTSALKDLRQNRYLLVFLQLCQIYLIANAKLIDTLKKKVKTLLRKFTPNRRRRENRDVLIMRYYEKRLRNFHTAVYLLRSEYFMSTLCGFKVILQNVHV